MWPASLIGLSMMMKKKKVRSGTLGTVGDRVKSIRKELGLTQKALSAVIDISITTISDIESGRVKPGFYFLKNFSERCSANLYYLLFGFGSPFSDGVTKEGVTSSLKGRDREFWDTFFKSDFVRYTILSQFQKLERENKELISEQLNKWTPKGDND
jgi:transcriptional regulator with XRE-family HTH domain